MQMNPNMGSTIKDKKHSANSDLSAQWTTSRRGNIRRKRIGETLG